YTLSSKRKHISPREKTHGPNTFNDRTDVEANHDPQSVRIFLLPDSQSPGDLHQRCRPNSPKALPDLPSPRRSGALFADDLRAGAPLGGCHETCREAEANA